MLPLLIGDHMECLLISLIEKREIVMGQKILDLIILWGDYGINRMISSIGTMVACLHPGPI